MNRFKRLSSGLCLIAFLTTSASAIQSGGDWDDLGPNVRIQEEARPIVERFDRYYRSQNSLMCRGEVRASLRGHDFDEVIFLSARAQRPNLIEVAIVGKTSPFPTDIFVSDGAELFEQSIRLQNYMISSVSDDFQSLHDRVRARSAPNVPVEIITSLMSDSPMMNLLQLSSEPGLVRLIGTSEVNGVKCDELCVNELGTRLWITSELPPRLMRYQSSPALMKPRYLPEGAIVTGPQIVIDFKSWGVSDRLGDPWSWAVPENSNRMATMHENAAAPGPEVGFETMLWEGGGSTRKDAPSLTRNMEPVQGGSAVSKPLAVGRKAPDAKFLNLEGVQSNLDAIRNGRPAVVIFWVPGGKFSRSSMPGIIRSARGASNQVMVIPVGSPMTPELAADDTTMPGGSSSWCDPEGGAAQLFGVPKQPAVFFIESDGTISDRYVGPQPAFSDTMTELVKALESRHQAEIEEPASDEATEDPTEADRV